MSFENIRKYRKRNILPAKKPTRPKLRTNVQYSRQKGRARAGRTEAAVVSIMRDRGRGPQDLSHTAPPTMRPTWK